MMSSHKSLTKKLFFVPLFFFHEISCRSKSIIRRKIVSSIIANVLNPNGSAFAQIGLFEGMVPNRYAGGMMMPGISWKLVNIQSKAEAFGIVENGVLMLDGGGGSIGKLEGYFPQMQVGAEFTIHFTIANLASRRCQVIQLLGSNLPPRSLAGNSKIPAYRAFVA